MPHQLGNNVDRLVLCAHSIQLDQLRMPQLLHYLRFSEEIFRIHCTCHNTFNESVPKTITNINTNNDSVQTANKSEDK